MKVFFNAPQLGKKEYLEHYQKIKQAIEASGAKLVACPVLDKSIDEVIKEGSAEALDYYNNLQKWIKEAEICVFEVSYPSTNAGHEIALALFSNKPVVALHIVDTPGNLVLNSIQDDRLQVLDYSMDDIASTVEDALDYASENMDTRFNFFISPSIGNYLDWISKVKKVPRAVFLRQLIEEDMKIEGYES